MRILALGLRHCHNAGVAHRDIKPENILVVGDPLTWAGADDRAGIVKLCDFGLCASIHDGAMLNDFVGSPGFFHLLAARADWAVEAAIRGARGL